GRHSGRGRPQERPRGMHTVMLMDRFVDREGVSVPEAARIVRACWAPAAVVCLDTLRNTHARLGELARIYRRGFYVPAASLMPLWWRADEPSWSMFSLD